MGSAVGAPRDELFIHKVPNFERAEHRRPPFVGIQWTGEEPDADPEKDSDRYKRFKGARREFRRGLYHGHVLAWTVTPEGEHKVIPPDAWGPEVALSVGCFLDVNWRAKFGLGIDEATSPVDGLLAKPASAVLMNAESFLGFPCGLICDSVLSGPERRVRCHEATVQTFGFG